MKFIWEEIDLYGKGATTTAQGILAKAPSGDLVLVNRKGVTSLRDGHRWLKDLSLDEMVYTLNGKGYTPIVDYVNADTVIETYLKGR